MEAIKLSTVLSQLDEKLNPDGNPNTFSIKFVKKNGELVFYNRCTSTGLNLNLKPRWRAFPNACNCFLVS